jgi:hypothetical protein
MSFKFEKLEIRQLALEMADTINKLAQMCPKFSRLFISNQKK